MEKFIMDYGNILIAAFGVLSTYIVWLQRRTEKRIKDTEIILKRKNADIEKIKIDAANDRAQMDILKELVADIPKSRATWQLTIQDISRQSSSVMEKLDISLQNNTEIVATLSGVLEIQTSQFANVTRQLSQVETTSIATQQSVETIKTTIEQSFELVKKTIENLHERFDTIIADKTDNSALTSEIQGIASAIETMNIIVSNIQSLVKQLPNNSNHTVTDVTLHPKIGEGDNV